MYIRSDVMKTIALRKRWNFSYDVRSSKIMFPSSSFFLCFLFFSNYAILHSYQIYVFSLPMKFVTRSYFMAVIKLWSKQRKIHIPILATWKERMTRKNYCGLCKSEKYLVTGGICYCYRYEVMDQTFSEERIRTEVVSIKERGHWQTKVLHSIPTIHAEQFDKLLTRYVSY